MKPALQLAASLRTMASSPLPTDDEQADLRATAELLEKIEGFAGELERKAKACRGPAAASMSAGIRLAAKGITYDEEARRLRHLRPV